MIYKYENSEILENINLIVHFPCPTVEVNMAYSRTPDRDFRCIYPCEITLSHIPAPALGKDKKTTAARRLHAGRTSIPDVIVMLK